MYQRVSKGLSEHILTMLQVNGPIILGNKASLVESTLRDAKKQKNSRNQITLKWDDLFTNTYIFV